MQVIKFGGRSIKDRKNILNSVEIAIEASHRDRTVLVASAIAGCTDKLVEAAHLATSNDKSYKKIVSQLKEEHFKLIEEAIHIDYQMTPRNLCRTYFTQLLKVLEGISLVGECTNSTLDLVMGYGELLSTAIIWAILHSEGINSQWVDAREVIVTFPYNGGNVVDSGQTYENIRNVLKDTSIRLFVVPGFIAGDINSKTTTLGRGGSDYTAALFAAASNSRVLEIWSDVDGIMSGDPKVVSDPKTIGELSYKEAWELSHFGAKVLYPPTIQPAIAKSIPIVIKNSFNPKGKSTTIEESPPFSRNAIRGLSGGQDIALLSIEGGGMVGVPGYSARFFTSLAEAGVDVILITQSSSLHTMCVAIEERDALKGEEAVNSEFAYEISLGKVNPVVVDKGFSIISLVGNDMKNQSGTAGKMFRVLGEAGINIRAIAQGSSEKNISAIVATKDYRESTRLIHDIFFKEENYSILYLYLAGYGSVAGQLLKIIEEEREEIKRKSKVELRVAGICTTTKMVVSKEGVSLKEAEELKSKGKDGEINSFINRVLSELPGNSIFVDCTANEKVASIYRELLSSGVSVVTCNKLAPSSTLNYWKGLKEIIEKNGVTMRYETTVGAALPIIETIARLIESGEKIVEVQAILSGTLNYLFSSYSGTTPFGELLNKAKELGYTEPDPSIDLSGSDVLRKCTILARECGFMIEQREIEHTPAAPSHLFSDDRSKFIEQLLKEEPYFTNLYRESSSKGEKLRYVATIRAEKCSVKTLSLPADNPLYHIEGTDNSVIIKTENYPRGITISGAGAGARVTAGGVLNDILKSRR